MSDAHSLPMALRAAYLAIHRQTNAHLLQHGVTADQFVCLFILNEEDAITQKELARRATSDPNTIRAMLVLLEKNGYVAREQHPNDGRARVVTITKNGREIFAKLSKELEPVRDRLIPFFDEREVEALIAGLRRIAKAMR